MRHAYHYGTIGVVKPRAKEETISPPLPKPVKSATFLKDGSRAEFAEGAMGVALKIPQRILDDYDTIAIIELAP